MNGAILDKTKVLEKYYNYLDESEELYLKFLLLFGKNATNLLVG
jgi:hypothetical protein